MCVGGGGGEGGFLTDMGLETFSSDVRTELELKNSLVLVHINNDIAPLYMYSLDIRILYPILKLCRSRSAGL